MGSNDVMGVIQREKDFYKAKVTFWLFVGLNIFLFILLCLTVTFLIKDLNLEIEQNAELCVECSYLIIHPDDELVGVSKRDDGICCVEGDQNLYELVHMFAARWMKKKLAEANPKHHRYSCGGVDNEMASIKVVGRQDKGERFPHRTELLWDSNSELAIIPDDTHMAYHPNGHIEIKRSGLYFVYSQVVLEHDGPGHVEDFRNGPVMYQHAIQLIESGKQQSQARSILTIKDSRCSSSTDKFRFTSNIGSAFELHAGDRLFVVVNDVNEVIPNPSMNHFGVHKL